AFEPFDVCKKKHLEQNLVPALDDVVVKIAKLRKRQPQRCRGKAREVTSKIIHYYSSVCVKSNSSMRPCFSNQYQDELRNSTDGSIPENLNTFAKIIKDSLDEIKKLQQFKDNQKLISTYSHDPTKRKPQPKIYTRHLFHADFYIDENES
ncbi:unnamed protein product, partial [Lymnaea stagnalis]